MSELELMTTLRFLKLVSASSFAAGCLGVVMSPALEIRKRFAYWVAGPAFGLSWILGFVIAGWTGRSFLSLWILSSMLTSTLSVNGVLWAAGHKDRGGWISSSFILLTLLSTFALMVWRPL